MADVLVVGGGIGGLAASLLLARQGHAVTVVERDDLTPAPDVETAFAAQRQGAPQARHSHGLLARLRSELQERLPDVHDEFVAAGAIALPLTGLLGEARPGDEELVVLAARRTTLEWVLRRAVAAEPGVTVRTGAGVAGLTAEPADPGEPGAVPTVTGLVLDDGTELHADVVVLATGRRSVVPEWLAAVGVEVAEEVHESGLVYMTRWYSRPGGVATDVDPEVRLAGDHGFVKYLAFPGDADAFSITLAVRTDDAEMRALLADPDRYHEVADQLPGPAALFAQGDVTPATGVLPMGGLINRLRRFVDADGRPVVAGLHALGDAHTCTNPIYGRGCSLALLQAGLLVDALAAHPDDPDARSRAYEAACRTHTEPWFTLAVQGDAMGADPGGAAIRAAGSEATADSAAHDAHKAVFRVFAAGGRDPVVGRGILRLMNMLATPSELMTDPEFLTKAMEIMGDPESYPLPEPPAGPDRATLLALTPS